MGYPQRMTPQQFAAKWAASKLSERSGSHQHFIDLCHVLGEPTPADADLDGESYCFERGAVKTTGGKGWADVWRKGCFAWEYKGKHKNLDVAYAQLQRYAPALDNPPLLVVSDMERIEVHTNFTNTVHERHDIRISELGLERNLKLLKAVFSEPEALEPGRTKAAITEDAAEKFAALAQVLRDRGGDPELVANFLNRILFCLYAQHAKLLPEGIVTQLFETGVKHPDQANRMLRSLFRAMKKGGEFGPHIIDWFNGGLFENPDSIPLEAKDIKELLVVARLDWSQIEPSIFGTLFERGLDPDKRAQIGAHYTDSESIMHIVRPVVIEPLAAEWKKALGEIRGVLGKWEKGRDKSARTKIQRRAQQIFDGFLERLKKFQVLDPACGSGNFLYIALQALKDLEHRATLDAEQLGLQVPLEGMHVGVHCLHGIERNRYAADLARVTVWIGEIQWMLRHGMQPSMNPILKPLDTIECRDAVCARDGTESQWPSADVIVGNPPFLGNKRMLSELGEVYTSRLRRLFKDRLPGGVDLVTYWFERAREQVEVKKSDRVGLVATQAIRKGANRTVLDRITTTAPIFEAWTNQPWVNEGAAVRVSVIAFGHGRSEHRLDGHRVDAISADLTPRTGSNTNLTQARLLPENRGICFMGTSKVGSFDIPGNVARAWLKLPNPNGAHNSDVLKPWANGQDLAGRLSDTWIIDFGTDMPLQRAALYEAPFAHVQEHVQPERKKQRRDAYRKRWWIHAEARPGLRAALRPLSRYIATPRVAKHRFFVWLPVAVLPDSRLFAICREDDFTFGILSSRFHTVWALANASRHGIGNDPTYNATSCFETFPFPSGSDKARKHVALVSKQLSALREGYLNPPQWVDVISERDFPPHFVPKSGHEGELKSRTMTNLYNNNPAWLQNAHKELDQAVAIAYGWSDYTPEMPDDAILARLLKLNAARSEDLLTSLEKPFSVVRVHQRKGVSKQTTTEKASRRKSA